MDTDFNLSSRPTLVGHICKPTSLFTVYGRVGDFVEAGDVGAVAGQSPFEYASMSSLANAVTISNANATAIQQEMKSRMDDWLVEACRIAGVRRVRIHAISIGNAKQQAIDVLEQCVDAAGGDRDEDEVYLVPTTEAIRDTIVNLFAVRRNLRFVD